MGDSSFNISSVTKKRPSVLVLDQWEILPQEVTWLEMLGRGEFGEVHKAILKDIPEVFQHTVAARRRRRNLPTDGGRIVAVKTLSG